MDTRILVVDDDPLVSGAVKEVLDFELGCAVMVARCGADALRQMAAEPFDVVITDLHMPGMDGLDLMGRIQAWYPRTCLVLMTADMGLHVDQALSRFGDSERLSKPFSGEDLLKAVERALAQCV